MAIIQRLLALAFLPVLVLLISQTLYPGSTQTIKEAVQAFLADSPLVSALVAEKLPSRSDTPLVVTAFPHWSHYEKIAKVAIVLAELGYPINFITGRIFEDEVKSLHPNITFWPIRGKPDKLTEEDYEMLKTFTPGSVEQALFMQKKALIDSIPDQHETLQEVFRNLQGGYGKEKPLISLYDLPFAGHHPILLGAPGIQPDASIGLSCHPITLDSHDSFPFYMGKRPHTGPDAQAVHHEANHPKHMDYVTREVSTAFWEKVRDLGAVNIHDWNIYHTMAALPDFLMSLGVPDFEFTRADLRPNIHYFGGFKTKQTQNVSSVDLPDWWDDVAAAKAAGKKIVAVSQGTLGLNLNDLLIPTLEALDDRDDVLVIATTVAVEVEDVPGLVVPSNARVAKFVPYDLLLPQVSLSLLYVNDVLNLSRSTFWLTMVAMARLYRASSWAYPWS
jgi:hypothetical protein